MSHILRLHYHLHEDRGGTFTCNEAELDPKQTQFNFWRTFPQKSLFHAFAHHLPVRKVILFITGLGAHFKSKSNLATSAITNSCSSCKRTKSDGADAAFND